MSDIVIKVENIWKEYRLGVVNHHSMAKDLQSWWARVRGKEDPNAPVGSTSGKRSNSSPTPDPGLPTTSPRAADTDADRFWALKDISFEVKQGERVGIIGRNGAGKSTLLKIMSNVTTPTRGQVTYKGRIASLLEVGTGFHPELTGRENIFLNGAILGMTKKDIRNKFDEIVDFSGVEKFIDTPVKRYSSGMYVRLAFAVAAHLDVEILIIDEVLAVGDAEFQKKCLGKMESASKEGRTVIFVSHNMAVIQQLCKKTILLNNGRISKSGVTMEVVLSYMDSIGKKYIKRTGISGPFKLEIYTESMDGKRKNIFNIGDQIRFIMLLTVDRPIKNAAIGLGILDSNGERVVTHHTMFQHPVAWGVNKYVKITVDWAECILCHGPYHFVSALYESGQMIAVWEDIGEIQVIDADYFGTGRLPDPQVQGKVVTRAKWRIEEQ